MVGWLRFAGYGGLHVALDLRVVCVLLECVSFVLLYDFCNGDCFGLFDLLVSLLVGSGGCLY